MTDDSKDTTAGDLSHTESPFGVLLVVALTGVLIIRPEEVYPALEGFRLYYVLIICSILYYGNAISREFRSDRLSSHPLLVIVLAFLVAVVASQLANFRFERAFEEGQTFAKVVLYYVLLTACLTSLPALRKYLTALIAFIAVQATLAVMQYHGYIDIEALHPAMQAEYVNGELISYPRLCGSGIYHDPNDFCLLLAAGILLSANRLQSSGGLLRVLWVLPLGFFGYAVVLTKSRGGLMAVVAGLGGYCIARYGVKKTAPFLLIALIGLMSLGGRATNIDLSNTNGTAQERIQKWQEGFILIPSRPIFGIGAGEYEIECGLVAHNSYVHAYVELGLFGGGLFLAAFLLGSHALATVRPDSTLADADELDNLRVVFAGMVVSYMIGMYSLSRTYIVPTYLTLALVTIYLRLAAPWGIDGFVMDRRMIARMCGIAIFGYLGLRIFITIFVQYG